jgi:EF-hand domain-containing family member B
VIAPNDLQIEKDPEIQALYIKTHGNFECGQQRDRKYNWKFDPKTHVFGKKFFVPENGAKNCLQPDFAQDEFPRTRIVKKNVEDYRNFRQEPIGKVKNQAQTTTTTIKEGHAFGFTSKIKDEWDAAKCISGEPTEKEVETDFNLGKSVQFGYRTTPHPGDEDRVFGVPTIRSDIKQPECASIADPNNYGNEPQVIQLLFPEKFSNRGLSQEDFNAPRSKEQVAALSLLTSRSATFSSRSASTTAEESSKVFI